MNAKIILLSLLRSFAILASWIFLAWIVFVVFSTKFKLADSLDFLYFAVREKDILLVVMLLLIDSVFYFYGINPNKYFKKTIETKKLIATMYALFLMAIITAAIFASYRFS